VADDVIVDVRSDTVTRPSEDMRAAMAAAEVGDDVYGEDPTVNALQDYVADLFGYEAALFAPTGSMANQIALQVSVPPASEMLCDADAHIVTYEIGAAAALGGISSRTWPAVGADINVDQVASMIRTDGYHAVVTRVIAVEQTHNRAGGAVIPMPTLRALRVIADADGIAMHCDGARIWHAHVADGVPLRDYGAVFDTMSVCLSKGLGAPVGSVVLGSADAIEKAWWVRKRMGGGMRQAGILAAAGLYALQHNIERVAVDHERARRLAEALVPYGVVDLDRVRTNIVSIDLTKSRLDAPTLVVAAAERGVRISSMGRQLGRVVFHMDVTESGADRVIDVLTGILSG
jgi:threonine aldolase